MRNHMTYPLVVYNTEFPENLEKFYEYIANNRVFNKRIRERKLREAWERTEIKIIDSEGGK